MNKDNNYAFNIFVVGSMFFVLGFVTWLNAILMPFLKSACELTNFQSSFVPFAFYISYFFTAIPSSLILRKTGFNKGMQIALIIMSLGAVIFIPAAITRFYLLFLIGLFILGIGLSLLQTAVNPYTTILGPIESAARRISIMGICNKFAGMIGIFILSKILFTGSDELMLSLSSIINTSEKEIILQTLSNKVIMPYIIMALILLALVIFIKKAKLPEIDEEKVDNSTIETRKSIFAYKYLWLGVFAIFFYVGAEVIAIDYLQCYGTFLGFKIEIASKLSIYALLALVAGYLLGIILIPKYISQRKVLIFQVLLSIVFVTVALLANGWLSAISIILLSFTHAIMWPAIWPLSIRGLGKYTKLGSAFLVMAIAGGAIIPLAYGKLSDVFNPQIAYSLLFISYLYILFFATKGYKIEKQNL